MARATFLAVTVLALTACGGGPSPDVRSGSTRLVLESPRQDQVLSVRSVSATVRVEGTDQFRLHYYLDGADRGEGDATATFTNLPPGNHHIDVEALHRDGSAFSPRLRAGADFVIQ